MVRIYKNTGKIVTDASSVDIFRDSLATGIEKALKDFPGDENFTLLGILKNAFPIAFKLAGYKADEVLEIKQIT